MIDLLYLVPPNHLFYYGLQRSAVGHGIGKVDQNAKVQVLNLIFNFLDLRKKKFQAENLKFRNNTKNSSIMTQKVLNLHETKNRKSNSRELRK